MDLTELIMQIIERRNKMAKEEKREIIISCCFIEYNNYY